MLITAAIAGLKTVPGAMIAVPSASPLGISPAGLREKDHQGSVCDIDRSCDEVYAIVPAPRSDGLCELNSALFSILRVTHRSGSSRYRRRFDICRRRRSVAMAGFRLAPSTGPLDASLHSPA